MLWDVFGWLSLDVWAAVVECEDLCRGHRDEPLFYRLEVLKYIEVVIGRGRIIRYVRIIPEHE